MRPARRHGLASETGITLIETLVTVVIVTVGILSSLSVFASSSRTAVTAERGAALTAVAQRELEKVRALPYSAVGQSSTHGAGAPSPGTTAAAEPQATGGVVNPGPERFELRGVSGSIYRFVTWRAQDCPLLDNRVSERVATTLGVTTADVNVRVGDLCSGTDDTKRVTIVAVADQDHSSGGPRQPVRLSTLVTDPSRPVTGDLDGKGLRVDLDGTQQAVSPAGSPVAGGAVTPVVEQHLYLHDTPCSASARQAVSASHPVHDTSRDGVACGTTGGADLMARDAITGSATGTVYDFSNDLPRPLGGGRVIEPDDRAGSCDASFRYAAADAGRRKRSVHTWATAPLAAPAETAITNGRATVTLHTATATGEPGPGRLCLTLWRRSTGEVLGHSDYALPVWADEPTGLSVAFDTVHANLAAGERLMLTVRVPEGSPALSLFYDHPAYPSSLTMPMEEGAPLS